MMADAAGSSFGRPTLGARVSSRLHSETETGSAIKCPSKTNTKQPPFWSVVVSVTCLKIMLINSYKSTDFEVHRNWLALTHSLPIDKWYIDETSKWTLDYPPFFAWFEYVMSFVARLFDPEMLVVQNLNYASERTVLFQRLSVIVSDLVLVYACWVWCSILSKLTQKGASSPVDPWNHPTIFVSVLLLWNPGLIIVDHIHFQYNGFLLGILLLSLARIVQDRCIEGAFWFSVLLNLKHIYLYVAPAYFVYLLRSYCLQGRIPSVKQVALRFLALASVVILVFGVSFGPFIFLGQTQQVMQRLFPFKRGLTHAYWAPNFWALYNAADKFLQSAGSVLGIMNRTNATTASMTGGLVQEYSYTVLPNVTPLATMLISVLAMMPILFCLWRRPGDAMLFVRSVVLCALVSFMFGWHVHEKAILLPLVPLTLLTLCSWDEARTFSFLAPVAHFSLFPLLFREAETPLKILLVILHTIFTVTRMPHFHAGSNRPSSKPVDKIECVYLVGLLVLQVYHSLLASLLGMDKRLPFLPLMMTSIYCAFGVCYAFLKLYTTYWRMKETPSHEKKRM